MKTLIKKHLDKKKKVVIELSREKNNFHPVWYIKVTPINLRDFNRIRREDVAFREEDEALEYYNTLVGRGWVKRLFHWLRAKTS